MKSTLIAGSLLATALFAGIGILPAMAQNTNTPNIDRAQQELNGRIQQGLATGQLAPSEAQNFYRGTREIEDRENRYKADGSASPQERQNLRGDLEALRADVERSIARPRALPPRATETPGIDNRKMRIQDRIDEGVRAGSITRGEARRLERREREIARLEARYKADGVVTQQERRELRAQLTTLQDDVERMLGNDRRDRYNR
ncbi:MAG: hypothetical protein H7315_18940 [Herminiimonas sp.]|nr:hypothetical protein [Herminiimonas sp.]